MSGVQEVTVKLSTKKRGTAIVYDDDKKRMVTQTLSKLEEQKVNGRPETRWRAKWVAYWKSWKLIDPV